VTTMKKPAESMIVRHDVSGICELTINRPEAYNALSIDCMETLQASLDDIRDDAGVRVVIISGSGNKFSAGHDLKELRDNRNRGFYEKTFTTCSRLMMSIVSSPKPFIAKVRGIATAAGCQLVASCDLAVAAEDARFATPGVNIGLFCSTPMVAVSRAVARKHAMEMLLLGEFISAQRAYDIGLVNRVTSPEELDGITMELAMTIASKSAPTLRIGKLAFQEQIDRDLKDAYEYCNQVMVNNMMAGDASEGIAAFLEKRVPKWGEEN
jgi:enoyl-CoA hydratase/carnithine racemase